MCVFSALPAIPHRSSPSSSHFSWVYGISFKCWTIRCYSRPPSPFQTYESKCLEELLCKRRVVSPVKVSGCPSAPQVPRAGLQRWRAARVAVRTSPTLSTPVATALAPLLCPASLCTHGSVNKVRALFLDASTPFACLFPCPL